MRRTSFLCLLLLLFVSAAWADEVYVPSNTPASGTWNYLPFNAQYGNEWRYQLSIPSGRLGNRPMQITDIAFAPFTTGDFRATAFEVRMSHSTVAPSTTFAANLPNPQVVLFSNAFVWITVAQTWCPIGLTAPFLYNGVDSLTIELRFKGGLNGNGFNGACCQSQGTHSRIYNNSPGAYTATTGSLDNGNIKVRLTISGARITLSGTARIGTTVILYLDAPSDAGKAYQLASSLGTGPIPIGTRQLDLSPDSLLLVTVFNQLPAVFVKYAGILDTNGKAQASINIPSLSALTGVRIHSAYVTLDPLVPLGISLISPTDSFIIQQ